MLEYTPSWFGKGVIVISPLSSLSVCLYNILLFLLLHPVLVYPNFFHLVAPELHFLLLVPHYTSQHLLSFLPKLHSSFSLLYTRHTLPSPAWKLNNFLMQHFSSCSTPSRSSFMFLHPSPYSHPSHSLFLFLHSAPYSHPITHISNIALFSPYSHASRSHIFTFTHVPLFFPSHSPFMFPQLHTPAHETKELLEGW